MSPKSKPGPRPAKSTAKAKKPYAGVSKSGGSKSGGAKSAAKRPAPTPAPARRIPMLWVAVGAVVAVIVVVLIATSGGDSSSATNGSATASASSAQLLARTKAADVPLLDAEGFATHTHTQLDVVVNGKKKVVPAGIGIDTEGERIAALHTHDATGLVHLESAKANDSFTLEQFLTVWGMPKDAAGRCAFFGAASPCTITVKSKDSGAVGLDVDLADYDTLTLTVTST